MRSSTCSLPSRRIWALLCFNFSASEIKAIPAGTANYRVKKVCVRDAATTGTVLASALRLAVPTCKFRISPGTALAAFIFKPKRVWFAVRHDLEKGPRNKRRQGVRVNPGIPFTVCRVSLFFIHTNNIPANKAQVRTDQVRKKWFETENAW